MTPTPARGSGARGRRSRALLVPWRLALLAALAILVVTVVDCLRARRPPSVERSVPQTVARERRRTPVDLDATGDLPDDGAAAADGRAAHRAEAGGRARSTRIVAVRRGAHPLPAPATRVDGPLGLGSWIRRVGDDAEIRVYPGSARRRRLARATQGGRYRSAGLRRGPLGLGTEFESVREYHDDDDVRQINWRATQRMGHPMSNQFRVEREREVLFLVDCGRLTAAPVGGSTRLDVALDSMLAVAATADELGDRSGAIAFDDAIRANLAARGGAAPPRSPTACSISSRGRSRATTPAPSRRSVAASARSCSSSPTSSTSRQRAHCSGVARARTAACGDGGERHRPGPRRHRPGRPGRWRSTSTARWWRSTCSPTGRASAICSVGRERTSSRPRSARSPPACIRAYLRAKQRARL